MSSSNPHQSSDSLTPSIDQRGYSRTSRFASFAALSSNPLHLFCRDSTGIEDHIFNTNNRKNDELNVSLDEALPDSSQLMFSTMDLRDAAVNVDFHEELFCIIRLVKDIGGSPHILNMASESSSKSSTRRSNNLEQWTFKIFSYLTLLLSPIS